MEFGQQNYVVHYDPTSIFSLEQNIRMHCLRAFKKKLYQSSSLFQLIWEEEKTRQAQPGPRYMTNYMSPAHITKENLCCIRTVRFKSTRILYGPCVIGVSRIDSDSDRTVKRCGFLLWVAICFVFLLLSFALFNPTWFDAPLWWAVWADWFLPLSSSRVWRLYYF